MRDKEEIIRIFPLHIRRLLEAARLDFESVQEIRLRVNQPLLLIFKGRELFLSGEGQLLRTEEKAFRVSRQEVQETMEFVGRYSLYAYEDELRQGFLTLQGGHRVGVAGKVVLDGDKVRGFSYISCINVRLSHQIKGCADSLLPYLREERRIFHTLIISPPGMGKTTLLRDLIRQISDGSREMCGCTVGVVDERSEICGCFQGIPANEVGMRTDVMDACPKAEGMMMLIRSMAPEVIAVDEIGSETDIRALESALFCGCRLLATVHGNSFADVHGKPLLAPLLDKGIFERYVVLGRGEHPGTLHQILDGKGEMLWSK